MKRASKKTPIIVFASGRGTNAEAIYRACRSGKLRATIVAIVCDRENAPVREKAKKWKCPVLDVSKIDAKSRDRETIRMLEQLPVRPEWAVLAGYMRVVGPELLKWFASELRVARVVNIHPALLPAFPGLNGYRQAFEHGCKLAGATVHLVDEGVDTGPICAQRAFAISDCQSVEAVEKRGLAVEHALLVETLQWLIAGKWSAKRSPRGDRLLIQKG